MMFCVGMIMVTNAGMFILQLFDNHAATYSALIIGCAEVRVIITNFKCRHCNNVTRSL